MVVSVTGAQPSGASIQVQAGSLRPAIGRLGAGLAIACSVVWLTGCSKAPSLNPVDWWHNAQGGRIAEDRPDPPGADDPYPNLSTVPARPTPPDRDAMKKLTDALVGDRTNARYAAEAAPLADPSSPSASPNLFGSGTLPPPPPASPPSATPAASASLPAASAPPAPAAPPARAPVASVQSTPLDAPAPVVAPVAAQPNVPAATPPPAVSSAPVSAAPPAQAAPVSTAELAPPPIAPGVLPPLPTEPPARAGVAPAPPPPPPPAISPIPPPASAGATVIPFAAASSAVTPTASEAIKAFAAKRGGGSIVVTGYGDAVSSDPGSQTVALSLALTRAQAVANALAAAGVPQTVIRVGAEAGGRGVGLRLLQ